MAGGQAAGGDKGEVVRNNLELGELEQLTISNDNDLNYDQLTAPKGWILTNVIANVIPESRHRDRHTIFF